MNLRDMYLFKNFGPQTSGGDSDGSSAAVIEPLVVTQNGEYTPGAGVDGFAPVTVEVAGGGGYSIEDIAQQEISGDIVLENIALRPFAFAYLTNISKVTLGNGVTSEVVSSGARSQFTCSSVTEVTGEMAMDGHSNSTFTSAFTGCTALKRVLTPNWQPNSNNFKGCTALELVDVAAISYDQTYENCNNLKVIVLRSETTTELMRAVTHWAFSLNNTPFDSEWADATGGYVLVPSALIAEYQAATNWVTLYEAGTCTFLALEDYTVDGTITGELDETKIQELIAS